MKIYLLRHAKASAGYPDEARELAEKGVRHAEALGTFMRKVPDFTPVQLYVSQLTRAQQTARIVMSRSGRRMTPTEHACLSPEADPKPILELIEETGTDTLIVGHNPNLEILTSLMMSGSRSRSRIQIKTCNLVCLEYAPIGMVEGLGDYELKWAFDPRLLPV